MLRDTELVGGRVRMPQGPMALACVTVTLLLCASV